MSAFASDPADDGDGGDDEDEQGNNERIEHIIVTKTVIMLTMRVM